MHTPRFGPQTFARSQRNSGGFTLIRLLAVIVVTGLLSALAAPALFAGLP